ncbi:MULTISPECIES: hypothetical protein [Pseudofrankia]|uniref:hypothetical protein n=1 Tax=Pseudofrankia TaxID=2994363 RepID=UPI000234CA5F|nr:MULTISPECIES: hypothetical protein [Pseudofrankia]OHV41530.1 hypothetical protein BCD49_00815 [Pseudofrankia sp. EUN1h]
MRSILSTVWSFILWQAFAAGLVGTVAGGRILDVDGTQKQLIGYGSAVVSLVAGSLLAKREPLKSVLASRKVQWFLFLFNGAVAAAAYFYVGGAKGIAAAAGMGLVSLGAGFGLLKRADQPPPPPRHIPEQRQTTRVDLWAGTGAGRHRARRTT